MNIAVQIDDVSVSFQGREVVHRVSLALPARTISVVVGRSGSGKTTLLRAINRLNEEFPHARTTGQVRVDVGSGLEPVYGAGAADVTALRQRVGMVFQQPNVLPVSVFANVALPLRLVARCAEEQIADRVRTALEAVGLWDTVRTRLHSAAEALSGGQQQRLCLARALALQPAIVLLDEPTASLDVHATREIENLLQHLAREYTLILVSHSLAQAARLAQYLVVMEDGRVRHQRALTERLREADVERLMEEA